MSRQSPLSTELTERVLVRLGLSERPAPTLETLRAVYAAWCRKVPFDNVRKLIHIRGNDPRPLPGDAPEDFFESWLRLGTGGMCWSGNGALYALLAEMGFQAERGLATMRPEPDAASNHGTVAVRFGEASVIVDASILHGEPLPLSPPGPTGIPHPAWGVQRTMKDGCWHIHWRPLHAPEGFDCRLDRFDVPREVFREHHEVTRLNSPFNGEVYARLNRGDSVIGTAGGERIEIDAAGRVRRRPLRGEGKFRFLLDELGMKEEIVQRLASALRPEA